MRLSEYKAMPISLYDVACAKVKFADDGTIWISGNNSLELVDSMKKDLQSISAWTFKFSC